ncbi:MAG: hypothetical protein JRD89_02820 [Deltaproteobacteria bacterium]|nr:hypothetical protein [Deltaproteobacteria bacterium]
MPNRITTELLRYMAQTANRRGSTVADMAIELQAARDYIDDPPPPPADYPGSPTEYHELMLYYLYCCINAILKELDRRKQIQYDIRRNADVEIIQTLKERIPVADVIEWYTDVFYSNRDQMRFRCPLHQDNHPSGVIYVRESRWHCFQCGQHGDVLDAVCRFGRTDLPHAIAKLAHYIGIDTKPMRRGRRKGGVEL